MNPRQVLNIRQAARVQGLGVGAWGLGVRAWGLRVEESTSTWLC